MTARTLTAALLLAAVLALLAAAPAAQAASWRSCSGSDRANGITTVSALRLPCASALAVAKRTNAVKCFLNGKRCTHAFRGRSWTCRLSEHEDHSTVTCRAGLRGARYHLG